MREAFSLTVEDVSTFARNLHRQLDGQPDGAPAPGHLALMNMVVRAAGYRNFQHFRSLAIHEARMAVPEEVPDMGAVAQVLRQFDAAGRLIRWPAKTGQQKLALWALWARLPKALVMTEREVSARLNLWHLFGDAAIIRRTLWEMKLIHRTEDSREYRRVEVAPDPTARALIRAVTARRA